MAIVVGKIIGIKGTVRVFNTETQEMRVVEEGAEIFLDEVVITEDGATVAIATVDGNTISLGGSSEFVIDNDSVPVAALRELPDAIIGNFESLQAAIIDGNFESVTDAGTTLADEQVDLLRSQAETINTNNEAEELSSSNQEGVEDERNAETGEVTAGYVTETREIDLEEAAEATDDAVDEVAVNTPEPETEPDPETEPEPDPDPETTPDPEVDPDPVNVIIRLIALDDTQVPILDENGHYTLANTVLEGNDGNYMALAFASDATEFSPATRLEDQQGSVSITFGNLSAVGSDSQTTDDGSQDFNNTPILTISLDIPFNTGTYDDYLSDGGEQYTVTILPTSFVDPNETYTDVIIDESPVITTIIDDGQPNTPFDPNDPVEPNMESVRVVLVPTDAAGNIIDPVTIPEGETAYFKVILLDPNGNEIPNATGDVDVVFTDGTAVRTGTSEDAELDFAANNQTVSINQVFSADALGDYLSDSGETFDVAIVDGTYSDAERYENVEHDLTPVTTTIIDDGQPNTPFDPNDPVEPNTESVRVVLVPTDAAGNIIDPVTIPEGETAYFKVILLDPNGNEIPNATGDVDIVFTDGTAVRTGSSEDAELDFAANNQTVAINQVFSADALDDYLSDSGETFDVAIVDGTYSDATRYENVEHDLTPVTTTIIDDGQPNTPFDPNDPVEPDMESVRVVLVPTDAAGNIIDPVTIPEGETAYFKVILLDPNGNEIPNATGEVDIVFTDGTAVRTGTSDDGELDFSANNQTVAINQVFSADALDDYLSDSGETFDVAIVDGTYSDAERYENVEHDLTPVTTTIIDDGQPNTPFDPNDPVEPNTESVRVVLVPTDAAGNIIDPVTIPEGETAYFKVILLDPNGNEIPNATGDVDIVFTDGTAVRTGTSEDAELDFAANNQTVAINQVFSADALDDYLSDSGETFDVAIVDGTYSDAERYENVEHDLTPVTTTIIDDGQPNTPFDPNDPVEPNMESVRVVLVPTDAAGNIIDPVTIPEGETAYFKVILLDPNGNEIPNATGDVDIVFTDGTAVRTGTSEDAELDFAANNQTVAINQVFSADALDDYLSDSGETFDVAIVDGTYSDAERYENVEHDLTPVTTTIIDDGQPDTPEDPSDNVEPDAEVVLIKLFAADENGEVLRDVNGDYLLANAVNEGETANYVAYAFAEGTLAYNDNTLLAHQNGSVSVTFNDDTATGAEVDVTSDGTQDFQNTGQTVDLGVSFSTETFNDVINEGTEIYNVTIDQGSYLAGDTQSYETVLIDTTPVTTSINDTEVRVFVRIDPVVDTVGEGGELSYVLSIVDQFGNSVFVPAGSTIDVELEYTPGIPEATTDIDYTSIPLVTIAGSTSTTTFTLPTLDDYFAEGIENLNITITNVIDGNNVFENILPHTVVNQAPSDAISVTGTITDNPAQDTENPGTPGEPTDPDAPNDTPRYGPEDSVYVKIINNDTQAEGADLSHTVQLVDANGDPVTVAAGETITVTLTYVGSGVDAAEADDYVATTTVTIVGGTSETTFTNEALDDFFAENDEEYTVTIDTATQAQDTYENVALHTIANGAPSDAISVTGTITDNPAQDTENPGTPGEPTDPNDPNDTPRYGPEDSVYVKIINNDTQAEGAELSHTVQLVDANGDPVTVAAGETITITLTYQGSGTDAAEANDYVATTTVTIVGGTSETTFTNEALDDFFAENDEEYTVTIDTATQAQDTYENVALHTIANGAPSDAISVTGTITDNPAQDTENPGTPGEPTDPDAPNDTPSYGPEDSVYVKIINNDTQAEGADLSHTVQLVDANGDPVTVAAGETISVTLTYVGSGTDAAEADDYVATTTVTIVGGTSETTFTNEALDDFFAENDEEYTVTIDTATQAQNTYENVALHTIANGAPSDAISVTGTITDNPAQDTENPGTPGEPTDPDDPNDTPRYGPEDSVYVKIINNDTQAEGADLSHTVQLVDANGDPVTVAAGETITVTLTYVGSGADAAEADDYVATTTVTIVGGTSETTFTNEALDDFFAENDEEYTVTIDTATQAQDTYENVALHTIANGAPSDAISVTGTITDNPAQDTENPGTPGEPTDPDDPNDTPRYGPEDSVYVKIINNDTQAEGADLSHTVQLVDANGDPVTVAAGETITITLTYQGSGTDAAEIDDYVATTTVTIVGGTSETTFTNEALDDFFAENDEEYTVTIDTATQAQDTYENVALHTIANGAPSDAISVTGTITDNPAQDTENPGTPGEPTDPDDPNDTPRYGPEDSVYVKIINNDTQAEGADLSHTVQLVDANGDPVTVAAGETITITLTYVGSGADAAEANDYVATTTVTIVGGTSETDFTNEAIIDFLNENDEQYTITIDTVTQANGTYENVVPARDGATFDEGNLFSVTGTITNGMTVGTPDNAYVDEDQFVATDPTSTLTGTELDNGGVADPDGNSSSGATTLVNLTTVYDATEYEFQFEESLVLNSESDTDVSIPAAGSAELTSGGVTLEYVVSGNTFTAYAGAGRTAADKVFDIVMSNNTDDGGTDDAYVYTQYQNIDHPTADLATNPAVSDDTLTLTFGYRVVSTDINNSNESDILNFTVTVNDSLPENSPQSVSTNEDTAVTITISAEPFDNGIINIDNNKDGPQDIANGNSVDIYDADGNDLIGSLTNNGDGTVLFTPAANYNGQASFDYQVSDRDHDTASATVTINVLPIADGVTMQNDLTGANAIVAVEDNSNTNDSPSHTQTNFAIALGLVLPTVVDATDHTVTGTTTYDAIERQGLLYFVFDNTDGTNDGYLVGLDTDGDGVLDQTLFTLDSSNDGNSFSIYITDGDFHPTDLDNTGAIQLTQAEYAQLAISPIEDSHHNVDFTITTESHEVTDAGALLSPDVISSSSTQNVRVDLQAMTDPVTIELAVVNTTDTTVTLEDRQLADGAAGTDGQNDHINLTINEDENDGLGYVDLKAIILEQYGDLDGSENFRFEISSAADDGVQINVEGVGSRTISTTPVTFDFDVNDPYIRLTPPTNFSGDLSTISIRLIALDNDTDSTVTETETSDLVTLDVFVKPIADDVTLPDVTTVEDTAVKLFENIALTDTDGSESITTLLINNLPTGWVVKDHNGLILLTGNGTDDLSIDVATVGLANVQNYTITPPAHSSTDIALSVDVTVTDASTVDGTSESDVDTFNHTLNIEVTPFAERVDTNTDTLDADGTDDVTINPDHTYLTTNTGKEDGDNGAQVWFELGSIFAAETSNSLESHWSNEDDTNFAANAGTQFDSELTYAHLTLLSDTSGNYDDAGESVYAGGVYRYFDGTDYVVVNNSASGVDIPIEYLDSLEFIGPDQFAGDLKIKIEAKTVDYDEDGGSTNTQISGESYLRFTIDPVADDVTVAIKQSFGNEDAGRNVDGSVDVTSAANGIPLDVTVTTDDTDGSETYTIVLSDIPDGASIYYDGALISADSGVVNANITATNDAGGTWSVEIAEFDNAAAFNYIPVYNDNSDVTLTMSAQSIDGLDTGVALTNLAINVNVSGVADTPTHNATATNTITDTYSTSQNYNVIEHEDVGSVSLTSFFDSNNPGFSSADIAGGDGSETLFVKINLTSAQVSAGFSVSGAGVTMLTATSWLVASTDFANAQLNVPSNYSGEVDFSLDLQTVENDDLSGNTLGDSDFVNVPLSLLITPEAEGTVNQTATQNEDTAQILDFTFSGNGGPNESLTSIWINTESIPSDIQLVTTDHGTLTTTNNGVATWVELTVTNSVVETVTAEYLASGHDSDADYSFEFRYTVADTTVDGSAYTDITPDGDSYDAATIDYETATYNVTVNAVTDTATLTLGTITDNDGDGNTDLTYDAGSQTVTVTDNTVFGVPFTLTADDMVSEASNGQDIDGSERILGYVEVTGVPEGIDIVNGVYLGDIVDGNGNTTHTGRWRVAINDDLILDNAAGETNLIEFVVGRTSYVDINQLITIEVFHADNGAAVLSNTESFTLVIDGDTFGGTDGEDGVPMDIVVTPTPQDFVEDTPLTADQLLAVVDDAGSINDSSKYSITITNLSGATVTGMVNEGGFYSLTGEGDVNAVIASLQSIVITPNADQNINSPEQVAFDIVITTYGVDEHNAYTVNYTNGNELNIQPVTDQTTIEITGGGVSEDNATTFTIDLNNLADDGRNVLINNRLYIQVSDDGETENGSGNFGTFTFGDGSPLTGLTTINANDVQDEQSPANSLPPGSYYVIDVSSYNGTLDIRYTPPADQYGNEISLTAYALTQEDPDTVNSGYDTLTWLTSASQTTTVTPVNDGLTITPVMQGDEDAIALLSLGGVTLSDASESITGAVLRDVPFGYEVSLNGVALTGSISGEDADGNYLYDYNLNVSSEAELETVGIQRVGVEDFAGIITGLTLDVIAGESGVETAQSWPISVEFNPVADNLLNLTATKTLGDEYVWTAINLNANVKDADGSESLTVVFEGTGATALDNSAIFRLRDSNDAVTDIPSGDLTATFDAVLETWTIAGIPFDQLGDLEILYHAFDDDITVTVYTVDAVTGLPTDTLAVGETDVFNMSLDESQNIITGEEDNIIVTGDAGVTVDAGDGDDTITGGSGDDSITGGLGDDVITAGGGWDYVNFSGDIASYQFAYDFNTNTLTVSGPDGTDQIQGAEVLKFNGVSYQLKVGTTGNDTLDFIDSTKNLIIPGPGTDTVDANADDYIVAGDASSPTTAVLFSTLDDGSNGDVTPNDGQIIDGIIEGMYYETSSGLSGYTDELGGFKYYDGDTVTFSIGGVIIGTADAQDLLAESLFLQDLADVERTDLEDDYVQVMAVFLQSLDSEGNTAGGIQISSAARAAFSDITLNLSTASLADVNTLLVAQGYEPVDIETAMDHVMEMLIAETSLTEDDFVPFELQDEVVSADTLEAALFGDSIESSVTEANEADALITGASITDASINDTVEGTSRAMDNEGDVDDKAYLLVDDSLYLGESVILEAQIPNSETAEQGEAVDQGADVSLPSLSDLFEDDGQALPLPDVQNSEEDEVSISNASSDNAAADTTVVTYQDLEDSFKIDDSQSDF